MPSDSAIKKINRLIDNIEKAFVGTRSVVELAVNALFSGGHLIIIDLPGLGKTTLAKAMGKSIGGKATRIQFTPDLLPSDITGVNIYFHEECRFEFHHGPVFTNILLADEINRATPRTQASLLEAMEELQVSVDGVTHPLAQPFMVIATQNPVEVQGTFPLPEAQLDRFLISLIIGYPQSEDENRIIEERMSANPIDSIEPVMSLEEVGEIKKECRAVHVDRKIRDYIIEISTATRQRGEILLGASPRASLDLMRSSMTHALLRGRDFVVPEDVKKMAVPVLAHRLLLRGSSRLNLERNAAVVHSILDAVPLPLKK
ncbi:MAG: MoxR family ATPase [bacterium]